MPKQPNYVQLENLLRVISAELSNKPSMITVYLIIILMGYYKNKKKLTVKALMASVPYSKMSVYSCLKRLICEGWVFVKYDEIDKRRKNIFPSKQLINYLNQIA